jgi:hypothetical protein
MPVAISTVLVIKNRNLVTLKRQGIPWMDFIKLTKMSKSQPQKTNQVRTSKVQSAENTL